MSRWNNSLPILVYAATFILLEVAAVAMLKSSSSLQDIWINRFSHRVIAILWGGSERMRGFFTLKDENEALSKENLRLSEELSRLRSNAEAMEQLQDDNYAFIPARIVKMSRNTQHNYIIIDKGSEDGILPNSGIITSNGAVGIIHAVDRHYSYGLTFMNSKMSVSARLGRDGIIAPMVWDGKHSDQALMTDIPFHYEITPGDTVLTSGFSSVFPPDIPLGIVGEESRIVDGATNEVKVTLFQDFSTLRSVLVVIFPDREEIENLEMKMEDDL